MEMDGFLLFVSVFACAVAGGVGIILFGVAVDKLFG
jgi:hypothetical protein